VPLKPVRRLTESCIPKKKFVLNPIIDWTEQDVWDFIKKYKLPYNPLYDIGYKRVGCVGCPLSSKNQKKSLAFCQNTRKRISGRQNAW
jgi:phosphoadenosine phosphosulfate reductase